MKNLRYFCWLLLCTSGLHAQGLSRHSNLSDAHVEVPTHVGPSTDQTNSIAAVTLSVAAVRALDGPQNEPHEMPLALESAERLVNAADALNQREHGKAPLERAGNTARSEVEILSAQRTEKRLVMRCWQEGRLILQREISEMPSASVVAVADAKQQELRLFDLNSALCLVQER